jgi:hypothetical protein
MGNKLRRDIEEILQLLKENKISQSKALIGIDGFVDEIFNVVNIRKNAEEYTRIETLKKYGERILKAAGLSTNVEMVSMQKKLGGNGPIMSNALINYGLDVTYIGALGEPDIHPIFKPMAEKCSAISIANPGFTDAVEFEDGKLIVSKLESLNNIRWQSIKEKVGLPKLVDMINDSSLVGLENWTMVPYMSEIWKGMINEVLPLIKIKEEKSYVFFDLSDPEKRSKEDISEALSLIQKFTPYFKVILGLNLKEAVEIAEVLNLTEYGEIKAKDLDLQKLTRDIGSKLGIYCLVIHPVSEAAAYFNGEFLHTFGPYTPKPRLTTGAGDNFNAGFCLGQILGLSVQHSLVFGTATSGYYVRNAKSPELNDVIEFLQIWKEQL